MRPGRSSGEQGESRPGVYDSWSEEIKECVGEELERAALLHNSKIGRFSSCPIESFQILTDSGMPRLIIRFKMAHLILASAL